MGNMRNATVNQKTPSKWMLLSIAQSIFFLFGIPILCKKHWDAIFGSLSDEVAECLLIVSATISTYVTFTFVMLPIYWMQHPFFEQYKIQNDRAWPWLDKSQRVREGFWALSLRSLKLTFVNLFILLPIMAFAKIWLSKVTGWNNPNAFMTDDEHWPSTLKNLVDLVATIVLHEFGFYMTHRMMHDYPKLYKYHKVHHEYKMNTTLASQHNHPIDFILSIGGPALLAALVVQPHSSTTFQFSLCTLYGNLDDHFGYAFPWSPVRWFPLSASTEEHEFHHSKNMGCFGTKLSIFNFMFGGYEQYSKFKGKQKKEQ